MAISYKTTPDLITKALTGQIEEVFKQSLRKQFQALANKAIEDAVKDMAGKVTGYVHSWDDTLTDRVVVTIALNGVNYETGDYR